MDIEVKTIYEEKLKIAKKRLEIITPIIADPGNFKLVKKISIESKISVSVLYRLVKKYNLNKDINSLLPQKIEPSKEMKDYILKNSQNMSIVDISKKLGISKTTIKRIFINNDISVSKEIKSKIRKISNLNKPEVTSFTKEEDDFLRKNFLQINKKKLARILNKSPSGISHRLKKLNLIIPNEILKKRHFKYKFKKGHFSYNKLKNFEESIKISKGGKVYVRIRIPGEKYLILKHYYVWETHNGKKVPNDHHIIFKDGDTFNFDPANLECVHKKDKMYIIGNSLSSLPKEIVEIALLKREINQEINKYKKNG